MRFNLRNNFVWLRITDEGSLPEMRIWSILLTKSILKWCIHLSRSLFKYSWEMNLGEAVTNLSTTASRFTGFVTCPTQVHIP